VRTLGIDFSADPAKTAAAVVDWGADAAEVETVSLGWSIPDLADRIEAAAWTAIDAPFGWPVEFIRVIDIWSREGRWENADRRTLRFRMTDEIVSATKYPLSVSSDRIASTAMRCAELLNEVGDRRGHRVDRAGAHHIVEVYPGASLTVWLPGLVKDYKGKSQLNKHKRVEILDALSPPDGWLFLKPEVRQLCVEKEDALDALLCALTARAAAMPGATEPLPTDATKLELARIEGWIHVPRAGSLERLI
jgi:hypothetical protein